MIIIAMPKQTMHIGPKIAMLAALSVADIHDPVEGPLVGKMRKVRKATKLKRPPINPSATKATEKHPQERLLSGMTGLGWEVRGKVVRGGEREAISIVRQGSIWTYPT
jgi:hypothetical protein